VYKNMAAEPGDPKRAGMEWPRRLFNPSKRAWTRGSKREGHQIGVTVDLKQKKTVGENHPPNRSLKQKKEGSKKDPKERVVSN